MNDHLLACRFLHLNKEAVVPWGTIMQWLSALPWAQLMQILALLLPLLSGGKLTPEVIAFVTAAITDIASGKITLAWLLSALAALAGGHPLPPLPA